MLNRCALLVLESIGRLQITDRREGNGAAYLIILLHTRNQSE